MFKRAFESRMVCGWLLLAMLAPPALAEPNAARMRISSSQVAGALQAAGWKISAAQVKFLSQVTSDRAEPGLEVVEVSKWREDQGKARLRCHDRHACLPFFVLIEGVDSNVVGAGTSSSVQKIALGSAPVPPLMRSGDHVAMVFADKALRIRIPVICLQSGSRGQTIRVTSEDHKRFFKAEVVAPGVLRATTL